MENYLIINNLITKTRQYIYIVLTATIFLFVNNNKSFSIENIFVIDQVQVEGKVDKNFSREKFINTAIINSFEMLKNEILLSKDLTKVRNLKLKDIKSLVSSFQIIEEKYEKDQYKVNFKIFYDDEKIKDLLREKNISFSQPKNISIIFLPVLFVNGEMFDLHDNYFYKKWNEININNKTINFILPLEDLDDILKISKMQNVTDEINLSDLVKKYDVTNYALALMNFNNKNLKVYIKTNFNNNEISKNINYKLNNLDEEPKLQSILTDLKMEVVDIWKQENIINVSMPLTIRIKFNHKNLSDFHKLRNTFYKINLIKNYSVENFDINTSFFQIYYYGNPKKLRSELIKFGYRLNDEQGFWKLDKL